MRPPCLLLCFATTVYARLNESPEEALVACEADRSKLEALQEAHTKAQARIQELEALVEGTAYRAAGLTVPDRSGKVTPDEPLFWQLIFCVVLAITIQSLANGLTMGLVSLDSIELKMISQKQDQDIIDPKDRKQLKDDQEAVRKVLPLIEDHHLLMVTVLLVNCICGEVLPLFLDRLVPSWLSLLLSVTLVLMFSEVIPSAIFTGAKQLMLAARFSPLVKVWMWMFFVIAWPIARVLDCILGVEHKGRYNFAEMKALISMHAKDQIGGEDEAIFKSVDDAGLGIITTETPHKFSSESAVIFCGSDSVPAISSTLKEDTIYYVVKCKPLKGRDLDCTFQLFTSEHRQRADLVCFEVGDITSGIFRMTERDEIKIAQGAMLLSHATVNEHMQRQDAVTLDNVYMLEENRELNPETLREIENKGHSRILVYQGNMHNVRGFILTKQLITLYAGDAGKELLTKSWVRISAVNLQQLIVAPPDTKMLDLLNKFQEERRHIALISNNPEAVDSAWRNKKEIPPHVHMIGIITLEDVIERLLQEKIDDEFDSDKLGSLKGGVLRRLGTTNQAPAKVVRSLSWQDGDSKRNLAEPLLP